MSLNQLFEDLKQNQETLDAFSDSLSKPGDGYDRADAAIVTVWSESWPSLCDELRQAFGEEGSAGERTCSGITLQEAVAALALIDGGELPLEQVGTLQPLLKWQKRLISAASRYIKSHRKPSAPTRSAEAALQEVKVEEGESPAPSGSTKTSVSSRRLHSAVSRDSLDALRKRTASYAPESSSSDSEDSQDVESSGEDEKRLKSRGPAPAPSPSLPPRDLKPAPPPAPALLHPAPRQLPPLKLRNNIASMIRPAPHGPNFTRPNIYAPSTFPNLKHPSAAEVQVLKNEPLFKRTDFGGQMVPAISRLGNAGKDFDDPKGGPLRVLPNSSQNIVASDGPGVSLGGPSLHPNGEDHIVEIMYKSIIPIIPDVKQILVDGKWRPLTKGARWRWTGCGRFVFQGFGLPGEFRLALEHHNTEAMAVLNVFREYARLALRNWYIWKEAEPAMTSAYWASVDEADEWTAKAIELGFDILRDAAPETGRKDAWASRWNDALAEASEEIGAKPEVLPVPSVATAGAKYPALCFWGFTNWELLEEDEDRALTDWLDEGGNVRWVLYEWGGLHRPKEGEENEAWELDTWRKARAAREVKEARGGKKEKKNKKQKTS